MTPPPRKAGASGLLVVCLVLASCAAVRADMPAAGPGPSPEAGSLANHYSLAAEFDPGDGRLDVSGTLRVVADGPLDSLGFLLNGGLTVTALTGERVGRWSAAPGATVGEFELPATQRVVVRFDPALAEGEATTLRFAYGGHIDNESIEVGRGLVSPRWTEMSVGTLWYPAALDEPVVTSQVDLSLPPQYEAVGPGSVRQTGAGRWTIEADRPAQVRVTFAASDRWHAESRAFTGDRGVTVYALNRTPRVDLALDAAAATYATLADLYGEPRRAGPDLVVLYPNDSLDVLGLRSPDEAYSTGNLIAIRDDRDETSWVATLQHEVAHMWWSGGQPGTADEFLSESLAEYSATVVGGAELGADWLARRRATLAARSEKTEGSLRDLDGFTGTRVALLYSRGPTALWALHDRIGGAAMAEFLTEVQTADVGTLDGFLSRLADREGAETAEWFAGLL